MFPSDVYADLPGIDIEKGTINGVPAVMPGFWGSHLGLVDLALNVDDNGAWSVVDGTGVVRRRRRRSRSGAPPVSAAPVKVAASARWADIVRG